MCTDLLWVVGRERQHCWDMKHYLMAFIHSVDGLCSSSISWQESLSTSYRGNTFFRVLYFWHPSHLGICRNLKAGFGLPGDPETYWKPHFQTLNNQPILLVEQTQKHSRGSYHCWTSSSQQFDPPCSTTPQTWNSQLPVTDRDQHDCETHQISPARTHLLLLQRQKVLQNKRRSNSLTDTRGTEFFLPSE